MSKVFIIAEAGANHNRDFKQALSLIDTAVNAGADAVKFQTYSSEALYSKNTPDFAGYQNINKLIKDIELPRSWQKDLKAYCDDVGIEFMSTPFDEKAVDELFDIGVKRFKISGFEATDPRIVKKVASTKLPMIISAGIGTDIPMVQTIIDWITDENTDPDITFLHCNHSYPTPFEDINLGQITKLKNHKFSEQVRIGLSDHTTGINVPPLAVALGASTIEKHFTISRGLPGPDHPFAIEPEELFRMVQSIRLASKCMGVKKSTVTKSEKSFIKATRSVVSKCDIRAGELIKIDHITTKRPYLENAIPARQYYEIPSQYFAKRDIAQDEIMEWDDILRVV
jgi:N,N'-diacetyllegionaminate synthase